jgi:hypothetical protein
MNVSFKENGNDCVAAVQLGQCGWLPAFSGWNGRYTSAGHKIENLDAPSDFPFTITTILPGSSTLSVLDITSAKVNAYWDEYYAGATRIAAPTFACNCHGFSTDIGYWVQDIGIVWQDDWNPCTTIDDVVTECSHGASNHSIKITAVAPANENQVRRVWETIEKMAYAGTYKSTYALPGGIGIGATSTYKKK